MTICIPDTVDLKLVKAHLSEFELDDRDIEKEQFLIIKKDNTIIAFCRLRKHAGCDEICSLGVIYGERGKGYAKLLLQKLIEKSDQPLYLACIIPDFFASLGFKIVSEYPVELADKLNYCTGQLCVPEKYVAMRLFKN